MSDRTHNRFNLSWESTWWGPHEASATEFICHPHVTPVNAWNRYALDHQRWAGIVPPHVTLFEAVRRGIAEIFDERWIVEQVGDAIVVRRTDLPWWQYRIQQVSGIVHTDGAINAPFRIHAAGSSPAPIFSALRIEHPISLLDHRIARDTLRIVTGKDKYDYNNGFYSFWVPETSKPDNLYVDINERGHLWMPRHLEPTLAEKRRAELASRKPWESKRAFPESDDHRMAIRAVWAIWVLVDIAERHPRASKLTLPPAKSRIRRRPKL